MKTLIAMLILTTQTFAANAMVLAEGSPRPVEQANIKVIEAKGIFENVTNASLTRVKFEQTFKQGFALELKSGLSRKQIVFNIVAITEGGCGETIYHAVSPSTQGGNPLLVVTDHRNDHCDYWTKVSDWAIELTIEQKQSSLIGEGQPAPIFTPMSTIR